MQLLTNDIDTEIKRNANAFFSLINLLHVCVALLGCFQVKNILRWEDWEYWLPLGYSIKIYQLFH